MSYNIAAIKMLHVEASMTAHDIVALHASIKSKPESCFLRQYYARAWELVNLKITCDCETRNDPDARFCKGCGDPVTKPTHHEITIKTLEWSGDGSGHSYQTFKDVVLPKLKGKADMIVIWEDASVWSGLRVRDGVLKECQVELKLID